jgi:hypothetical protein
MALYPHAIAGASDPEGALSSGVGRGAFDRKWRFHDEMKPAIRPDQQGEILIVAIIAAGLGDFEDPLRVFKQSAHVKGLSAETGEL